MADFTMQRFHMVEGQVRANDVPDVRIQHAMLAVQRERFVPMALRSVAYADRVLEISPGRFLLDARTFSKLLQLAELSDTDRVLDVACGTGYSTVVLAQIAGQVIGLEQDADLVRIAADLVHQSGVTNATVVQGGLVEGFRGNAPYDVILIEGAVETVPEALFGQLAQGGRLLTVIEDGPQGHAHVFLKEKGQVGRRMDFDSNVPVLAGFTKKVGFVF